MVKSCLYSCLPQVPNPYQRITYQVNVTGIVELRSVSDWKRILYLSFEDFPAGLLVSHKPPEKSKLHVWENREQNGYQKDAPSLEMLKSYLDIVLSNWLWMALLQQEEGTR